MKNSTRATVLNALIYSLILSANIPIVDFDLSMKNSVKYNKSLPVQYPSWNYAKTSFETHIAYQQYYQEKSRIPKIIHQIWVGPKPLPESCKALRETWLKYNPDWEYILWTNELIEKLNLKNKARYYSTPNYGEKADIARYEILYRFGGLYIDTDFECLQSFDDLHHSCDFYTGISSEDIFEVYNGLIGSKPGHPILKLCIDEINKQDTKNFSFHPNEILKRTGPYLFTKQIIKYLPFSNDITVLFPVTYFYPWPNYARHQNSRFQIEKWLKPESFALHHWHTSWIKK